MKGETKLMLIKAVHTLVWIFFNIVIFYMLYAVLADKIDKWLWIGFGLVILEGLTLLLFKFFCPLTIMARQYSDSTKDNFDIYLPNWLARYIDCWGDYSDLDLSVDDVVYVNQAVCLFRFLVSFQQNKHLIPFLNNDLKLPKDTSGNDDVAVVRRDNK